MATVVFRVSLQHKLEKGLSRKTNVSMVSIVDPEEAKAFLQSVSNAGGYDWDVESVERICFVESITEALK